MKECKYKELIDDYLFNRLSEDQKTEFEEHYFNCPECFKELQEKDLIISTIKAKGKEIFKEIEAPVKEKKSFLESVLSFLSPRQWVTVALSAALITVIIVGVLPSLKSKSPQFFINEDLVRGESITLISPVFNIQDVPNEFRWKSEGEDVEYQISIYNHELIWRATTKDNFIALPEEVKNRLVAGEQYSWQVKAFSPEGILIAVSSRVLFQPNSK
jgi:hypothetical protein